MTNPLAPQPTQRDSWFEWGKYVLKMIEYLCAKIVALEARIERLHEKETERQITMLDIDQRMRSVEKLLKRIGTVIGAIGTSIVIFAIIELLKSLFGLP